MSTRRPETSTAPQQRRAVVVRELLRPTAPVEVGGFRLSVDRSVRYRTRDLVQHIQQRSHTARAGGDVTDSSRPFRVRGNRRYWAASLLRVIGTLGPPGAQAGATGEDLATAHWDTQRGSTASR